MGNRTAKFVSALVGSIIAGAPLAAVSQNAPTHTEHGQRSRPTASPRRRAPRRRGSTGIIASSARPSGSAGICAPKAARSRQTAQAAPERKPPHAADSAAATDRCRTRAPNTCTPRSGAAGHRTRRAGRGTAPAAASNSRSRRRRPMRSSRRRHALARRRHGVRLARPAARCTGPSGMPRRRARNRRNPLLRWPWPRPQTHRRQAARLAPDAAARDRRRAGTRRRPRQPHLPLRRRARPRPGRRPHGQLGRSGAAAIRAQAARRGSARCARRARSSPQPVDFDAARPQPAQRK